MKYSNSIILIGENQSSRQALYVNYTHAIPKITQDSDSVQLMKIIQFW